MNAQTFQEEAAKLERLLYSISWSMLSSNDDCADAVQEALTKAWQSRDSLKNSKAFRPWLTRIMVNTCNDMLRKRSRQRWVPLTEDVAVLQPPEVDDFDLDETLGRLSPEHRAVVVLHYLEGYKIREIAGMLDIPAGTVKSRLMFARVHLQKNLVHSSLEQGGLSHEQA